MSACVWLVDECKASWRSSLPNKLGNYNVTRQVKETDGHWNGVKLSTDGTDVFSQQIKQIKQKRSVKIVGPKSPARGGGFGQN